MFGNFFNKFIPCGRIKRLGRSDLPENEDNAPFLFDDVYKNGTRAKKLQADAVLCGRSMVEMLGVLAIIGVLSVGGLEGYSRAMFKHKLNKHAEALNSLINTAMQYSGKIANNSNHIDSNGAIWYSETFYKAGLLPDGIKRRSSVDFEDIFQSSIWLFEHPNQRISGLGYHFPQSTFGIEICYNLVEVVKQNADNVYFLLTDQKNEEGAANQNNEIIYGDKYCSENRKCLSRVTKNDLDLLCRSCQKSKGSCRFYVEWKY